MRDADTWMMMELSPTRLLAERVRLERALEEELAVYWKIAVAVLTTTMPKITIFPDGSMTHELNFTKPQSEILDMVRDRIREARERHAQRIKLLTGEP